MRITFFIPTILVLICAATFFYFANEPITLIEPKPLIRAADELVNAEDQKQYSRKLENFRKQLYAEGDADFHRTREVLLAYVVSRDRAARRIPDPGFQQALLNDAIEVSKKRLEDRSFRLFVLGGGLLLVSAGLLFIQARKALDVAQVVRREFPRENHNTVSGNLNALLKALRNKALLIEDLQGSIADLNGQLRQFQSSANYQRQFATSWNEPTLLMEESLPKPTDPTNSDAFPSLGISGELSKEPQQIPQISIADPLDLDPPDLFEPKSSVGEIDLGKTHHLEQNSEKSSVPAPFPEEQKSLFSGSPSQTSELLYTQFLLGLAENIDFPQGSQVFSITVSSQALDELSRTYQDSQFGVRLFGFCVERILTYFQMGDRTYLHFDEGRFLLTFCVPPYLHGSVNEEEINNAFRTKAIYLSGIPVSLPDFDIQQYQA